jgi:prepilin-type N-terminal cleavage/methylation domain-containing protein
MEMTNTSTWKRFELGCQAGYTLVEVLVGIVIFAIGVLALTQLQGNLAKTSADSNGRTVAINIAEEIIEQSRSFSQIPSGTGVQAFNDIVTGTRTVNRGGVDYAVAQTVTNYYYVPANGTFSTTKPNSSIVDPDMKLLTVDVTWGGTGQNAQSFQIDGSTSTQGLNTGTITLTDVISSITSPSGGKVVLNKTSNDLFGPPVNYNPGNRPDIISIQLGENRFKESTTPLPDVIRADELVETTFDVVTYSQSDSGATFLRREEFRAVSCECTLRASTDVDEGGLRPTVWNGNDYTEGEFVAKPYGESANNQQSDFCTVCCRDHHDGGTGTKDIGTDVGLSRYDPFRSSFGYWQSSDGNNALLGDHKHYKRNNSGTLSVAGVGDTYVEACRLVRKDGFFRVAQDLRQEGMNSFPADFLDEDDEVEDYSDYVTAAVNGFEALAVNNYETLPPSLVKPPDMSPSVQFPGSSTTLTSKMTSASLPRQQLRSRGVYIDYMSDELRLKIDCLQGGGSGSGCGVKGANSALEVIPFYDVQLTWLARWNETPNNKPIEVTNEAVQDNNAHTRGVAVISLTAPTSGSSVINAAIHKGNLGLTATDPIDPWYASDLRDYDMHAEANSASPPVNNGIIIKGTITSSVGGVKAADVEISATGANCDRTNTGFECVLTGANNPRLTVSMYYKRNKYLVACSSIMSINGTDHSGDNPEDNWTRFNLPGYQNFFANVVIKENSC